MSTATTFILGAGATLSLSSTSTGTYVAVGQLKQISFSASKADYADITNLSSPSAATGAPPTKEYAPSVITPGTATVTGILAPSGDAGQIAVSTAFGSQTLQYWKLQFAPAAGQTTGALRSFSGFVAEKPAMDAMLTDAVSFNFSVQVTGLITDTPGTSS